MYILKNALVSIKRNMGRNLLIGLIIMVVSLACSVTLATLNSANSIIDTYEENYKVEASISMNRMNFMGNFEPGEDSEDRREEMGEMFENIESLTKEEIENYADSEYVKSYYYTTSISMDSEDLTLATTQTSDNQFGGRGGRGDFNQDNSFTLTGYSSYSAMSEFIEGRYEIVEGEVSSDFESDNCIVSYELATLNELEVGDEITLNSVNDEDFTYKLTVTGIYQEQESENGNMQMFSNSANTIITNSAKVLKISEDDEDLRVTYNPTFVLKSMDVIEDFKEEVTEKGLSETYQVSTNEEEVENATSSISNVKSFSLTFLIVTFIIGAVVLFVINMINVRERKYEIGVLRTIGMKKSLLSMQFTTELIIVALISLFLGCAVGAGVSKPVANYLLENEIENSQNQQEQLGNRFGNENMMPGNMEKPEGDRTEAINGFVNIEKIDSIDAVVDFKVLGQLLIIGLLLTIVSSISSTVAIQRFSPLTILKERS